MIVKTADAVLPDAVCLWLGSALRYPLLTSLSANAMPKGSHKAKTSASVSNTSCTYVLYEIKRAGKYASLLFGWILFCALCERVLGGFLPFRLPSSHATSFPNSSIPHYT